MAARRLNPFRYGRPVPAEHFVGRHEAVRVIFSRILNSESTAVVGEPHIGKSSLLQYIADEQVRSDWLADVSGRHTFVQVDCHMLPSSYAPQDFWKYVTDEIEPVLTEQECIQQIEVVRRSDFGSFTLKHLFGILAQHGRRVVLLIDEFDALLHHPNFNSAEFFGSLRSLASSTSSLVIVIASRLPVSELNRRSHSINPLGSPFFNTFIEHCLYPLRGNEVVQLLNQALEGTDVRFAAEDIDYITRMVGTHPYLVQMAAAALFEAAVEEGVETDRLDRASDRLRRWTASHYDDLWRYLRREAQTVLVILVLAELKGRIDGRDFDTGDLGSLEWYRTELNRLADSGLVERLTEQRTWHVDFGNFVVWHGHRWRVSAGTFVLWIADNAIAGTRKTVDFEQWLHNQEVEGLMTRHDQERLKELAGKIPKGVVTSAAEFVRAYLQVPKV
jgi:hypothetical protein